MTVEAIRSGIDLSYVDSDARPQDDLFGHVNGRWLAEYKIPADRATDGAFRSLYDRAEEQVRDLITGAADGGDIGTGAATSSGTDEQRIGDLYASFMDEQTVAERGVQPLLDELATIDARPIPPRPWRRWSALCSAAASAAARAPTSTPTPRTRPAICCTSASPGSDCPTSPTTAMSSTPRFSPRTRSTSPRCSPSCTAGDHAETAARASSRWRPSWPPRTGTSSSAATPTLPTTCARSPTCRPRRRASTGQAG